MATQENLKTEWNLSRYFYDGIEDPRIDKDVKRYPEFVDEFINKYKGKITTLNEVEFKLYLRDIEFMATLLDKPLIFLFLSQTLNVQDVNVQKKMMQLEEMMTKCEEKLVFITEEYKTLGADFFYKLSSNDKFTEYSLYLKDVGDSIKYMLSEKEEIIITRLGEILSNFDKIYEEHTTAIEFEIDGKKYLDSDVSAMRQDKDREVRRKAWEALHGEYSKLPTRVVMGRIYSAVCKDNVFETRTRGFKTVMTSANDSEHLSDEAVDKMLDCITAKFPLYQRFLEVKRKMLGYDQLHIYDMLAPADYGAGEIPEIKFEDGWEKYISIVRNVDPIMASYSEDMLNGERISVFPKKGKESGAYANYTKTIPSFVMLNWDGTPSALTTLGHELGHAFHGELQKKQGALSYGAPLVLSETASIFTETIMFESIISEVSDERKRKQLIAEYLDDLFSTTFRQIQYVNFEKRCHNSVLNDEPLTYVEFDEIWLDECKKLYGDNVKDMELISNRWSQISHIFATPFYCYSYAFGNILSLNLIQMYRDAENKEEFIKKYHEFLSAGGSEEPEVLMKRVFGIELDEKFYDTAFKVVEDLIEKLEK